MREVKAVTITTEKTADGWIIGGLEEGFVSLSPEMARVIVALNDEGVFFPYEIHPLLHRGEPVRHGFCFMFEVSLMPDIRL
jgi:hypothetical protein